MGPGGDGPAFQSGGGERTDTSILFNRSGVWEPRFPDSNLFNRSGVWEVVWIWDRLPPFVSTDTSNQFNRSGVWAACC